jgi:DNA-binding MarR family transcriptional regulator
MDVTDCYCAALRLAARKMTSVYDEALKPAGLNVAQFSLLRRVERLGPVSLTLLGRETGLDRSTVGRNVRVLQRQGYVKSADGDDGREACIVLASPGRRALVAAMPLWSAAQAAFEANLGGEAAPLRGLLARL